MSGGGDHRALLSALSGYWFVCGPDDRLLDGHLAEGHGLAFRSSELRGRGVAALLPEPAATLILTAVRRCRGRSEPATVEYDVDLPGGKRRYEARIVPLVGGRVGVTTLDATGPAATLEALRRSEERFRLAFKTSPDSIAINRASDGQYVATNQGFTDLLGWREDEVVGRSSVELGIWTRPEEREAMLAELGRSGKARVEGHFRRRNGEIGVGVLSAVVFDLDGVPHILSVTRDVTQEREAERERARLEQALRQSQKLEALGRLAGGIAHDFNNVLTGILGYAELLETSIRKGAPRSLDVEQIRRAAERARDLTRQLLAFARRQPTVPRVVSLNDVVRGSEKLLRRILGEDVELVAALAPDLWMARADVTQLEQVLLNLVVNGRDAMPDPGTLTIETANVELDEDQARKHVGAVAGPFVMLSVSDTGSGMNAETMARLFEPFFTTKPTGTGLGLPTVYGIVEQHGGHVTVLSEIGKGSTFRVHLPRTTEPASEDAVPGLSEAGRGSETVLVVEDDATVREFVERALLEAGYRVLVARDGRRALQVAAGADETIHLLLTDVVMPGMSGREIATRLLARRPALKVLYMSGYDEELAGSQAALGASTHLLTKPFTPSQLQRKVREVLDVPAVSADP